MKAETIKEAGLRHKEGIRHYQDRKSRCDEDFKAGACWLAERLMSIPFNEILEELVKVASLGTMRYWNLRNKGGNNE